MIVVRISVDGIREALDRLDANVAAAIRQAHGQSAAYAAELARQTTRFKDGPRARLRNSIRRVTISPLCHFVIAAAAHAKFVEDGTRPHVIRARNRKALRFSVGGSPLFRASVQHPGTKPTHFMRDARDEAEAKLVRFVEMSLRQAVSG